MGHRNSSTQCHDAGFFRVDRDRVAHAAAGASSLKMASPNEAARVCMRIEIPTADSSLHGRPVRQTADRKTNRPAIPLGMTTLLGISRAAAWLLLMGIRFYQAVFAPVMPVGCKFYPSCSRYAVEAITRHGALRGVRLAAARLLRCRPFTQGGFDPVPDPDDLSPNEVQL